MLDAYMRNNFNLEKYMQIRAMIAFNNFIVEIMKEWETGTSGVPVL